MYAWFFPRFERVIGNCYELWLIHRAACSCCDWWELIALVLVFRQSFENRSMFLMQPTPHSSNLHTFAATGDGLANFPSGVFPFPEDRRERPVLLHSRQIQFPSAPEVPAIHSEWYTWPHLTRNYRSSDLAAGRKSTATRLFFNTIQLLTNFRSQDLIINKYDELYMTTPWACVVCLQSMLFKHGFC